MVGWLPAPVRKFRNWDRYLSEIFNPCEPEYMKLAYEAEMKKRVEGVCEKSYGPSILPQQWTQALHEFVDSVEEDRKRNP